MQTKHRETGRFIARTDDGQKVVIVEVTVEADVSTKQPTPQWVRVGRRFRTSDGQPVHADGDGDGHFTIVDRGVRAHRE